MKASTLFVISIAVLVALGAMAGAKYVGLFDKKPVVVDNRAKEEPVLVLVANTDLHKDVAITSADVRVRELQTGEREAYERNRGRYMPANVAAAHLRVPADRLRADTPLLRENFVEAQPEPLNRRVREGMRSVTLMVPKDRSNGGLITVGEHVDVLLTTKITDLANPGRTFERTAQIARDCRVIAKRNNLRIVNQADAEGAPIAYEIEVNPYRAALLDYAKNRGQVTLIINPQKSPSILDPLPTEDDKMVKSFSDMNSKEYRDEDQRIEEVKKGELPVGDADLMRIFKVEPPTPKVPPITVTRISGINPAYQYVFPRDGSASQPGGTTQPVGGAPRAAAAEFGAPDGAAKAGDCPTCGKDGKAPLIPAVGSTVVVPPATASFSPR